MNNSNEVIKYLKALQTFCYGDLENFENQCNRIEKEEGLMHANLAEGNHFITSSDSSVSTYTLTTQTTAFPNNSFSVDSSFEKKEFYRSTIPHCVLLFSIIDVIGFLLSTENKLSNTTKNFKFFFSHLKLSRQEELILVKLYRHGMVHSFFPKKKFGVSYFSKNPEDELYFMVNGIITLNVNFLIKITKLRFESILEDQSVHLNINIQFKKLLSSDDKYIFDNDIDLEAFGRSL